jgi:biopolymer transport protein ExbD
MNFTAHRKSKKTAVLDITPMVDIIFQLLIFFLLTATYVKNPHLDINLPQASLNKSADNKKDIEIGVKDNGDIRYDNKNITMEQLEGILRSEYAADAKAIIVIRADKSSKHGRVVDIMDLAKRIGFEKLAVAVRAQAGAQ